MTETLRELERAHAADPSDVLVKKCVACGVSFGPSARHPERFSGQQTCGAPKCRGVARTLKARSMVERACYVCHRVLTVDRFGLRPCGLPLAICRECDKVKSRLKPRRPHPGSKYKPGVKSQARAKVKTALRQGVLSRQPCEVCGGEAQAHHEDYSRPLDVRWLCQSHHGVQHWTRADTPIEPLSYLARGVAPPSEVSS